MDMNKQKSILITGGSRGIGNAIARQMAKEGYGVAIMDVFDEAEAKCGIEAVKQFGWPVLYIKGDITSAKSRRQAIDSVMNTFARLDVLVNNAGVAPKKRMDILSTTEESFDFVTGINLKGTFFMTQLAANAMINQVKENIDIKPVIINISSMSAYTSSYQRGEYCISKAGISMITTLFADRLAEFGICVYEIRPGIIMTDMTATVREKYDSLINDGLLPIKRWGYPEDIANAVSLLCSGKLAYSTGEVINVDGGFHIRRL
jgi:3-oxoacyl-[acyl-carrier protein] reductase